MARESRFGPGNVWHDQNDAFGMFCRGTSDERRGNVDISGSDVVRIHFASTPSASTPPSPSLPLPCEGFNPPNTCSKISETADGSE